MTRPVSHGSDDDADFSIDTSDANGTQDEDSERSFEEEVAQEEERGRIAREERRKAAESKPQADNDDAAGDAAADLLPHRTRRTTKVVNYNEDALLASLNEEISEEEKDVDKPPAKRQKIDSGDEKEAVKDEDYQLEPEDSDDKNFVASDDTAEDELDEIGGRRRRKRKQQFVVKDDEELDEDGEFDPRAGDDDADGGKSAHRMRDSRSRHHRHAHRLAQSSSDESDAEQSNEESRDEPMTIEDELESLKREDEENGPAGAASDGTGSSAESEAPVHRNLRRRKQVNYTLPPPVLTDAQIDQMKAASAGGSPRKRGRYGGGAGSGGYSAQPVRRLFPTAGPFGGSEVTALFGAAGGANVSALADLSSSSSSETEEEAGAASDSSSSSSSDDDGRRRIGGAGAGGVGAGGARGILGGARGSHALVKRHKKNSLADTDPLGVDSAIDFSCVGGLDNYIAQLKEMITLPLLYPELYARFHVSPPRGVLFHGPPGTGKTLMARALASSCSAEGKKITFFMRKGADCLSKWVGEAERNLRLLFEEAQKQQPSIIFFDEIDGLAPVRSSKQEQIHASIVSTLLALMDGIDSRGQVVVIGATNRPDAVDPALRRPGRFDREFYFPLPGEQARARILAIHTRRWANRPDAAFIAQLAKMTRGYGGADLKALCAESALNAIQRTYPQIYASDKRLQIDPAQVNVTSADFARAIRSIVPSSARPTGASEAGVAGAGMNGANEGSAGTDKNGAGKSSAGANSAGAGSFASLFSAQLASLSALISHALPVRTDMSALEESRYVDFMAAQPDGGFQMQQTVRALDDARMFRPRALVVGLPGQAQREMCEAALGALEGVVVHRLDFPRLFGDATVVPETAAVQVFQELRQQTPALLFVPDILAFLDSAGASLRATVASLVRGIPASAKVMILGVVADRERFEAEKDNYSASLEQVFGISVEEMDDDGCVIEMRDPDRSARMRYFDRVWRALALNPVDFNDVKMRPRRVLPALPVVQRSAGAHGNKDGARQARRKMRRAKMKLRHDLRLKNTLKVRLSRLMDTFKVRYKRFRKPIIDDAYLVHLFESTPDPSAPYQKKGDMIVEVASGKQFHNMDLEVIEERLWNGYYSEPHQFLKDLSLIVKDAQEMGERDRLWKANEMYANAEVGVEDMEAAQPALAREWKEMRKRERKAGTGAANAVSAAHSNAGGAGAGSVVSAGASSAGPVSAASTGAVEKVTSAAAGSSAAPDSSATPGSGSPADPETPPGIVTSVVSSSGLQQQAQMQEKRKDVDSSGEDGWKKPKSLDLGSARKSEHGDLTLTASTALSAPALSAPSGSSSALVPTSTSSPLTASAASELRKSELAKSAKLISSLTPALTLDKAKVAELQEKLLEKTEGVRAMELERLYSRLIRTVWKHRLEADKAQAVAGIEKIIDSL